jgi:hypothetical protein
VLTGCLVDVLWCGVVRVWVGVGWVIAHPLTGSQSHPPHALQYIEHLAEEFHVSITFRWAVVGLLFRRIVDSSSSAEQFTQLQELSIQCELGVLS